LIGRDGAANLIGTARRGLDDEAGCRAQASAFVQCFPVANLKGPTE